MVMYQRSICQYVHIFLYICLITNVSEVVAEASSYFTSCSLSPRRSRSQRRHCCCDDVDVTLLSSPSITREKASITTKTATKLMIQLLRGGSSYNNDPYNNNKQQYENYRPMMTVGDLDNNKYNSHPRIESYTIHSSFPQQQQQLFKRMPPLHVVISKFVTKLHNTSPTLSSLSILSIIIYIMWQIPKFQLLLQKNFINSWYNVIKNKRYHSILTSVISHTSFGHIFINLWGYVMFGKSMKLNYVGGGGLGRSRPVQRLWLFVLGSSLFSSIMYLLITGKRSSGCLGLSGVTLAMFAYESMKFPSRQYSIIYFPTLKIPAQYMLTISLVVSVIGALFNIDIGQRNVAHATHLGGLLYGIIFYKLTTMTTITPPWLRSSPTKRR